MCFRNTETQASEPLIPAQLLTKNKRLFLAPCLSGIGGGMFYYGLAMVFPYREFPNLLSTIYRTNANVAEIQLVWGSDSLLNQGWMSSVLSSGSTLGAICCGMWFRFIRHHRIQLVVLYAFTLVFCGLMSITNAHRRPLAIASGFLMGFGVGAIETIVVLIVSVSQDVGHIGLLVGTVGTLRSISGSLAQAIYSTILNNQIAEQVPRFVTRSALEAGLPQSSLPALFEAIATQSAAALESVPGMTDSIAQAIAEATVAGYSEAFRYVYYASIAFGGASLIASLFVEADVTKHLTTFVGRRLNGATIDRRGEAGNEIEKAHDPSETQHTENLSNSDIKMATTSPTVVTS